MKDTDQCRRRVCKKAESPSMRTRIDTEMAAQPANTMYRKMPPWKSVDIRPGEGNVHSLAPNLTKIYAMNTEPLFEVGKKFCHQG